MSAVITVHVDGFVNPLPVHGEYTAPEVAALYQQHATEIVNVFQNTKLIDATLPGESPNFVDNPDDLNAADVTTVETNLAALKDLAQNGLLVGGKVFYLTIEMAQSIDAISKSLNAAGFDASPSVTTLKQWQDFTDVGLREIILKALSAVDSNRSLQSLIELEYVKTGNQVLGEQLTGLRDALTVTKEIIETLEKVQIIHNKIRPEGRSVADLDAILAGTKLIYTTFYVSEFFITAGTAFDTLFEDFGSFGKVVGNETARVTSVVNPDNDAVFESLYKLFGEESFANLVPVVDDNPDTDTIDALSAGTVDDFVQLREQIARHIIDLENLGILASDEESIAGKLQSILNDMNNPIGGGTTDLEKLENWILDAQQFAEDDERNLDSGNIQRRLTEGITSAESLNDKQKEDLRRFLFVFEEFYKSASSMLAAINRIIEKMAQGIKS